MSRDRVPPGVPPAASLRSERGVTLTELAIIGVLATMVMLALTGFYFNAQRLWVAGSTQAMAQRDATILVEEIRRRTHEAKDAIVDATTDPVHHSLALSYEGSAPVTEFRWHSDDSRVHLEVGGDDEGAIVDSPVARFQFNTDGSKMVDLTILEIRTADGDSIQISSRFALLGG